MKFLMGYNEWVIQWGDKNLVGESTEEDFSRWGK